jgi:hypothetical protein
VDTMVDALVGVMIQILDPKELVGLIAPWNFCKQSHHLPIL